MKTQESFLKSIPSSSLIFFKSDGCGHCTEAYSLFKKYCAEKNIHSYEVNAEDNDSSEIFEIFRVLYVPTLIVINMSKVQHFLEGGNKIKEFLNS